VVFIAEDQTGASDDGARAALAALSRTWPCAQWQRRDSVAEALAAQCFSCGQEGAAAVRAHVRGTRFELAVWRALLEVPPGALTTYGRLAEKLGSPRAARAVGRAVGANPLAVLIPCHRVILSTGAIGQYRWGGPRKRALLGLEAIATQAEPLAQ
jgi:AraC family transcriptional regulator of adaptative response/methylated-DNA-[protein]-cysteine methyltransferase